MNHNDEPVYVGRDFGGRSLEIDRGLVEKFSAAVGDHNLLYHRVAPGLILHSECYRDLSWYLKNIFGNLHARQQWELFAEVPVEAAVTTRGFIRERYRKRGRDYVVKETWTLDGGGRLLNRGITHQSFLIETPDAEERTDAVTKGGKEERPPRRSDITAGSGVPLDPLSKRVDEGMCMRFSGPDLNYHTDRESARAFGFPDIVIQGMLPICFISELLTRDFGHGWLAGGRMDVRLVNVLWANETVSVRAERIGETAEADRRRTALNVWVEKEDGAKVVVGTASALA